MLFKNLVSRLTMLVMMVLITVSLQAQDASYSKTAKELTANLAAKLNLNSNQTSSVMDVLIDYQVNVVDNKQDKAEASAKVNSSIEEFLNDEQKVNWQTVKNEWWVKVNEKISALETETQKDSY